MSETEEVINLKNIIVDSELFDKFFYLKEYQDVRLTKISALDHYIQFGIKEDRKPNKDFDPIWYREFYKDIKDTDIFPLIHYILFGKNEGRFTNSEKKFDNTIIVPDKQITHNNKNKNVVAILGIPRSGITLLTAIIGSHPKAYPWFLPYSTRKDYGIEKFTDFESIKNEYKKAYPEEKIETDTIILSESTASEENIEFILDSLYNLSQNGVNTKIIWLTRDINHTYMSQMETAYKYWGAIEHNLNEQNYQEYVSFCKRSYILLANKLINAGHILVSYRNLVENPEITITNIEKYLGLDFDKKQLNYISESKHHNYAGDPSFTEKNQILKETETTRKESWASYIDFMQVLEEKDLLFVQEFNKMVENLQSTGNYTILDYKTDLQQTYFDVGYYLENNSDIVKAEVNPLEHFIMNGWKEGRNPTKDFIIKFYLDNVDENSILNPFEYYLLIGRYEKDLKEHDVIQRMTELILIDPESYNITDDLILEAPRYKNPKVSIIVPAYNQEKYTMACIESIIKNTENDVSYEIIIMDDKSPDESARLIEKNLKNIKFITNGVNYGFLQNCNKGATFAIGEYILFLNNDTNVQPGWLNSLVELIESADDIGMVGSRLVYPTGQQQEAGGIIWNDATGWNFGRLDDPYKPEYNYVKEIDYISGASIMLSKNLWEEIGGFDERYIPAYFEDSDLAFEVRKHGYKVMYQPESVVVHFEGISHGTDLGAGIKSYQVKNKQKFIDKWQNVLNKQCNNAQDVFHARDRSATKPTIVIIDHYVPHFDQDAGSRTVFGYINLFISEGFNVKFIGDNFFPHQPYTKILQQSGVEVLFGSWYERNWKTWLFENGKYIDYIFMNRPHISRKYIDEVKKSTNAKVIYYGHDLHFLRDKREYELTGDETKLESAIFWKEKELELMKKSDMSIYPSITEQKEINAIDKTINVQTMPAYLFTDFIPNNRNIKESQDIMFVGGFAHGPNVDAVLWFIDNIWPIIKQSLTDVKFYIIGSKPTDDIIALASKDVIVTGFISDKELEKYYQCCRLAVVPLRYGAGIKGKIVEALYEEIPIVTTSVGSEGMIQAEQYMFIEDEANNFANTVIKLYNDEELLKFYSVNGKSYCEKYFSYIAAKNSLKNVINFRNINDN